MHCWVDVPVSVSLCYWMPENKGNVTERHSTLVQACLRKKERIKSVCMSVFERKRERERENEKVREMIGMYRKGKRDIETHMVWFLCLMAYQFRGLFNAESIFVEGE